MVLQGGTTQLAVPHPLPIPPSLNPPLPPFLPPPSLTPLLPPPQQCGILLGILLLAVSGLMTTWSCKMLVRAAYVKSKMSYETLGLPCNETS